jgi:hypothetical protein
MAADGVVAKEEKKLSEKREMPEWWCNFCGFRTRSVREYLSHSCANVLASAGVEVALTESNECR